MVILDLKFLDTILMTIVDNIEYQKDAQRNSVQKEVLNSSPSFFSSSLVEKTLNRVTKLRTFFHGLRLILLLFPW